MIPMQCRFKPRPLGFTLVELAIVVIIVGLLIGGIVVSIGAQQENAARSITERKISEVIEALIGYAAANNRLPCPAAPPVLTTPEEKRVGAEQPAGGGNCEYNWVGFVPARTLSLGPTDANGYLLDAWGSPIRYAVTKSNADSFTTTGSMRNNWSGGMNPDLRVCNTAIGIVYPLQVTADCATAAVTLADNAVAVIYSRGKNGGVTPTSSDESANGDNDRVFIAHTPVSADSSNEFDDIVGWLSPNILYSRLIAAGRLP